MPEARPVKVCIGVPSYQGPHKHTFVSQWEFLNYLGRLSERSYVRAEMESDPVLGKDYAARFISSLPPLDSYDAEAEIREGEGPFQFYLTEIIGYSLVGLARDQIVKRALQNNCDYVLFFDDDMAFKRSLFLKLWRHNVDFVAALAFTSREPIAPVLYRFHSRWNHKKLAEEVWSEPVFDYEPDCLQRIDGTGTGVVLIKTDVFKRIKEPWFHGSMPTVGEDVYFSLRCKEAGILIHCDSSAKTIHVPNEPQAWMDEARYLERKEMTKKWWMTERDPLRCSQ